MGIQLPYPKKGGRAPQFLAHLYCGQTARCIKMPLGVEIGLSPGDFVLDGDSAPYHKRNGAPPNFRPTSIVAKQLHGSRCHLVRWYRPRPTRRCVRCGPSYPHKKAHPPLPNFWPMSIVATVAHLSYCWALVYSFYIVRHYKWQFFYCALYSILCKETLFSSLIFDSVLTIQSIDLFQWQTDGPWQKQYTSIKKYIFRKNCMPSPNSSQAVKQLEVAL